MLLKLTLIAVALLSFGCQNKHHYQNSSTLYYTDGDAKPTVALVPVIDSSGYELPWSLSEELTAMINERLSTDGIFFVTPKEDTLSHIDTPFNKNISWIRQEFHDYDFVVFLELVEHEKIKEKKDSDSSSNLNMAMRIRLVDNRGKQPKVVLQELLKDSYFISKSLLPVNYNQFAWNSTEYPNTPMGGAHLQLCKNVAERLSDYLIINKNNDK